MQELTRDMSITALPDTNQNTKEEFDDIDMEDCEEDIRVS